MKITNNQLKQIIKEELEAVLNEGVFGAKIGRQLSPDKYHYDKKKPAKRKKASDLEYKGDNYDVDDINQKIAKKFDGKYKKLSEQEEGGPMPEGTGFDFQEWVEDNIIWSREFQSFRSALSDHEAYYNHPNSILFDDEYSQEEKEQEERELWKKRRETDKAFEAFRDLMQKNMTPDQEDRSDEIIEQHLEYI